MTKLTRQCIEDHLASAHTEESWARAITEMLLQTAKEKLAEGCTEEIVIDSQFRIRAVDPAEVTKSDGASFIRSPRIRVCVVVSPTGREVCFDRPAII